MIINILIAFSLGYLVGRFGHKYLNVWLKNPKWAPHHWIYGVIVISVGLYLSNKFVVSFGLGHFISDLKDFLQLKFFDPDKPGKKHFWGID